jgi:hypothetical protein
VYYLRWPALFKKEAELESPVGNNSFFGSSVAIHDNAIAIGAEGFRKFFLLFLFTYCRRCRVCFILLTNLTAVLFYLCSSYTQPVAVTLGVASCTTEVIKSQHRALLTSRGSSTLLSRLQAVPMVTMATLLFLTNIWHLLVPSGMVS